MGEPKQLYSDEQSSMRSAGMNIFSHDNDIKFIQTTTHAHTVEIFIITFRYKLYKRLDSLKQDENECVKHTSSIIENI